MDELERDLGARLRDTGGEVLPGDGFPVRIRHRVARRQRRRRMVFAAVPTACLLVGVSVFAVVDRSTPATTRSASAASPRPTEASGSPPFAASGPAAPGPSGPATGAPLRPSSGAPSSAPAVPSGWIPVSWGKAQVEVPPGSVVEQSGCDDPSAPVTVRLGTVPPSSVMTPCPLEGLEGADQTTLEIGGLPTYPVPTGLAHATVNGIPVREEPGSEGAVDDFVLPLGVEVTADGPLAATIVDTLSRSPRAAVLASGRVPRVPSSWRSVDFGGVHASVPDGWPVRRVADWGSSCGDDAPWNLVAEVGSGSQPSVTLDSGTATPVAACPAIAFSSQPVRPPVDGLVIDPGPRGPLGKGSESTFGHCLSINRLQVCPDQAYPYGELVLRVRLPSGGHVAVVIGLAGDGQTARTVLHSLRPA